MYEIKRAWLRLIQIAVIPVSMHSWPSKQLEYVNAFIETDRKSKQRLHVTEQFDYNSIS